MMEVKTDQQDTSNVFINDLEMYLRLFCEELGIEDATDLSQSKWTAFLMYSYNHLFKGHDVFKQAHADYKCIDLDIAYNICTVYVGMCYKYDKIISINGFTKLTGIDEQTINNWKNGKHRADEPQARAIWEMLNLEYERSLENTLISSKRNPIGIIAILNKRFGWKEDGNLAQPSEKVAISFNDLPTLAKNADNITEKPTNIIHDLPILK